MNTEKQNKKISLVVFIILLVVLLCGVFYFFFRTKDIPQVIDKDLNNQQASTLLTTTTKEVVDWSVYDNKPRHFEIKYPSYLSPVESYTHGVIVRFVDAQGRGLIEIDDALIDGVNDYDVYDRLQIDPIEKRLGMKMVANGYDGRYSVSVNNLVFFSSNEILFREILSTLVISGINPGISK